MSDAGWGGLAHIIRDCERTAAAHRMRDSGQFHRHDAIKEKPVDNSANTALRQQVDQLQRQVRALQSPRPESERDALAKAQHRFDSVAALFGARASEPALGESSVSYRKRLAASLQQHSPELKDARLDAADLPTLTALEDRIYGDAVAAARGGKVPAGQLREVKERDESGRLVTRSYGDPMSWMQHFMGNGASGSINRKPNG
jgi:hypothetical protein